MFMKQKQEVKKKLNTKLDKKNSWNFFFFFLYKRGNNCSNNAVSKIRQIKERN